MLYIGVDLGTSAVKLLLMDEKGGIKKIVSKEYELHFPHPGWSEQKPEDWYSQSMEGIKELISECDISWFDISFQCSLCYLNWKRSCHDLLIFHFTEG